MTFHPLYTNIKRPQKFTYPFCYKPHPLCIMAAKEVQAYIDSKNIWQEELEKGKMFGVLVVENKDGKLGYYAAYSGIILGKNDWDYFVPPIYDLLKPNGYFKINETEISHINKKIDEIEDSELLKSLIKEISDLKEKSNIEISEYQKKMKDAKHHRDELRSSSTEDISLIKESQFMKAELKRLKKRLSDNILPKEKELSEIETSISKLKKERKEKSDALQNWLFSQFKILNAKGEQKDLCSIFAETVHKNPPAGAGECCAPKLLQYAYLNQARPICMAEFWWGKSPKNEIRHHLNYYPACQGKCKPILSHAMQGLTVDDNPLESYKEQTLEILYEDKWLVVINKPAGMLSVPGKGNLPSVKSIAMKFFDIDKDCPAIVHRLDMATSGIMIVAKTKMVYQQIQSQFKDHKIRKVYIAILDGIITNQNGTISLPLRPDYIDRPRQVVDVAGKPAITKYEVIYIKNGKTRILLYPQTGRTHQLRVHCAHKDGLNTPILGDTIYGKEDKRLFLHAKEIFFTHPVTGVEMHINKEEDF